jgi:O-antigen/teichoic acid export membrane protein
MTSRSDRGGGWRSCRHRASVVADGNRRLWGESLFWSLVVFSGVVVLAALVGFWAPTRAERTEPLPSDDEFRSPVAPAILAIGCGLFLAWLAARCRNEARSRGAVGRAAHSPEPLPLRVPSVVAGTDPLRRTRWLAQLRRHRDACEANGWRRFLGEALFGTCVAAGLVAALAMLGSASYQTPAFSHFVEEQPANGAEVLVGLLIAVSFGLLAAWCSRRAREAERERSRLRKAASSGPRDSASG